MVLAEGDASVWNELPAGQEFAGTTWRPVDGWTPPDKEREHDSVEAKAQAERDRAAEYRRSQP